MFDNYRKRVFALENKNDELFKSEKKELMSTRASEQFKVGFDVNEELKGSVKMMYENMEMSEGINDQLKKQSGKIIESKDKVVGVRNMLGKSERRIKNMMLRIKRNKFILYGVLGVIIIVFIIILVSYFKQ